MAKTPKEPADLEAEIDQLKADIAKLVDQLKTTGEHSYGTARRAAREGVETLKAQGEAYYSGLRDNADELEQQVLSTIREKPFTSLAVAAGVGFLLALFARR
ncbi:MAG: YqjD family protein [Rhizobiaceae bacterium]